MSHAETLFLPTRQNLLVSAFFSVASPTSEHKINMLTRQGLEPTQAGNAVVERRRGARGRLTRSGDPLFRITSSFQTSKRELAVGAGNRLRTRWYLAALLLLLSMSQPTVAQLTVTCVYDASVPVPARHALAKLESALQAQDCQLAHAASARSASDASFRGSRPHSDVPLQNSGRGDRRTA